MTMFMCCVDEVKLVQIT